MFHVCWGFFLATYIFLSVYFLGFPFSGPTRLCCERYSSPFKKYEKAGFLTLSLSSWLDYAIVMPALEPTARLTCLVVGQRRHGNNSSPTGNLKYRGNSYCKVRDTVLDHNVIIKESYKASYK